MLLIGIGFFILATIWFFGYGFYTKWDKIHAWFNTLVTGSLLLSAAFAAASGLESSRNDKERERQKELICGYYNTQTYFEEYGSAPPQEIAGICGEQ